jgi:hypothetical protein
MSTHGYIAGECNDARERRIRRESARQTPIDAAALRRQKIASGEITPVSDWDLGPEEYRDLVQVRIKLANGSLQGVISQKFVPLLDADLVAKHNEKMQHQRMQHEVAAAFDRWMSGTGIDASQAQSWSQSHTEAMRNAPLSRDLHAALGLHLSREACLGITISAEALNERCKQLGHSETQRAATLMDAWQRGMLTPIDASAEAVPLSEEALMVLHSETLPMYGPDFMAKYTRYGFTMAQSTALAFECQRHLYYGDRRTHTSSLELECISCLSQIGVACE